MINFCRMYYTSENHTVFGRLYRRREELIRKENVAGDRPLDRRVDPLQHVEGTKAKVIKVQRISGPEKLIFPKNYNS